MTIAKRKQFTLSRRLIIILITGQIAINLGFVFYIWAMRVWQSKVSEILLQMMELNQV
jgi:hypothetical protein